ncbi:hypothetical protein [Collinsella ihumii]|uniref:hypothetical protein n=1 Tax=Collinsella ihumii TaxID=1720204 RepID=UPI0025AA3918|nr:hypothetical protein [Collinsella ihumii]MDN0055556.1 hypothetical protein [Collinsella ihumii]
MKKVIKGRLYDTATATEVAELTEGGLRDVRRVEETLYRKRTGEYFLHCWGGPASRYAERLETNCWGPGAVITPLTYEQARDWAEGTMDADEWQREFGAAEDGPGNGQVDIHLVLSDEARRRLEHECKRTGETRSSVVERLLLGLRG